MRKLIALSSLAVMGAAPPPSSDARLRAIIAPVSAAQMIKTVETLVSFGTRHTLSSQTDPKRGIGAALNWAEAELNRYSAECGGCLTVGRTSDLFVGDRIPTPTRVTDVFAIQRGTERPNDVVIITGHIDSRVTDIMNSNAFEPGANDDGSGVATVTEAARVLSKHKFPGTIVYAALMGEEQGLFGGKVLAAYAKAQGWNVVANLNNDIIGNSCGSDGVCDSTHVRVFSEGPRWQGHEALAGPQRSLGGENDAPGRNISRYLDSLADRLRIGLDVRQVWRNDRFGRGGDHTEFLNLGFPAVRFTVAVENYNWQHQDVRVEKGIHYGDTVDHMNFPYLAKVAKLNIAALAGLASVPPPPDPKVNGAVSTDTRLVWTAGQPGYRVWWRRTDANNWQVSRNVTSRECAAVCIVVLPHIRVDDWVFGVSSVSKDGFESPVASAVPGGEFKPYVPPPDKVSPLR
ncbi:M28 family peptidase [Sphingomonas sp.]|uniref:M28 family peptidase n=1 Tax=Sphingomonas sp. TaxID=28214 RepID=UPI0038A1270A